MRNYIKPSISFQFLNLATGVSDGCNMTANIGKYQCPVAVPGWGGETIFADRKVCFWVTETPEEYDVCYHGPNGIVSVLGS